MKQLLAAVVLGSTFVIACSSSGSGSSSDGSSSGGSSSSGNSSSSGSSGSSGSTTTSSSSGTTEKYACSVNGTCYKCANAEDFKDCLKPTSKCAETSADYCK